MAGTIDDKFGKFDELTKKVREFQDSAAFKLLVSGMHKVASEYYHDPKNQKDGELVLDEDKAKELSNKLWDTATEMVAVNHLNWDAAKIKTLKDTKNPADDESNYDTLMTAILGVNKEGLYRSLSGRKVVKTQEIDSLIQPIYQGFVQQTTSKMIMKEVKDIKDAAALNDYVSKLKDAYKKAFEGVGVPKTPASTEDAVRTYGSVIPLIPRDSLPKIAATTKAVTPTYRAA